MCIRDSFCNESIYKEHAELGCNTIRFTFNEALFFTSRDVYKRQVFKGCVPMGSEPVNLSVDPQETVLRAAEAGCGLTYTLSGSFKKDYLDSPQPMLGSRCV